MKPSVPWPFVKRLPKQKLLFRVFDLPKIMLVLPVLVPLEKIQIWFYQEQGRHILEKSWIFFTVLESPKKYLKSFSLIYQNRM